MDTGDDAVAAVAVPVAETIVLALRPTGGDADGGIGDEVVEVGAVDEPDTEVIAGPLNVGDVALVGCPHDATTTHPVVTTATNRPGRATRR